MMLSLQVHRVRDMVTLASAVETPCFLQALVGKLPFICTVLFSLRKLPGHCFIDPETSHGSLGGQGLLLSPKWLSLGHSISSG